MPYMARRENLLAVGRLIIAVAVCKFSRCIILQDPVI